MMVLLMCIVSTGSVFASTNTNEVMSSEFKNSYEYKSLSDTQKKELQTALTDKQLWKEIFKELSKDTQVSKVVKINDDVAIVTEVNTEVNQNTTGIRLKSASSERTLTSEYKKSVKILGVEILEFTGYVTYSCIPGKKIVEVKDANVYVSKNLNPVATVEISSPTGMYISGARAYGKASITFGAGWDDLDIDMGSAIFKVWGDYNYNHGGSITKN